MTPEEMLAEMQRKPDAHALIRWIHEELADLVVSKRPWSVGRSVLRVINAYLEATEGR